MTEHYTAFGTVNMLNQATDGLKKFGTFVGVYGDSCRSDNHVSTLLRKRQFHVTDLGNYYAGLCLNCPWGKLKTNLKVRCRTVQAVCTKLTSRTQRLVKLFVFNRCGYFA